MLVAYAVIAIAACKKPQRSNIPAVQQLPDAAVEGPPPPEQPTPVQP